MSQGARTAREGIVVGLIAYVSVAALYAVFDQLAARGSLYTLDLLGKALFRGLRDPAVLELPQASDRTAMALYNGLHLVTSLAIGLIVTWLATQAERRPERASLVGIVIAAGFVVTVLAVGMLTAPIRPLLPWWSIVVANGLAVVFAGWYLVRRHPDLPHRLLPFGGRPA
ncbi:MAG: hypothetical protein IPF98_16560 [Gemmatimonadetes bacterium]|nr:hypothetical protein [Gemmatimonadota bacterium]MCC6774442.1 hypothetical protein [Gemmatimonadaceae bacterium]